MVYDVSVAVNRAIINGNLQTRINAPEIFIVIVIDINIIIRYLSWMMIVHVHVGISMVVIGTILD